MMLVMLALSVSFVSCSDDDDDVSTSTNILVGTWATEDGQTKYVFNSNGTGSQTIGAGIPRNFTYTMPSETIMRIEFAGDNGATEYQVSRTGNILDLSRGSSYIRLYKQ